MTNDLGSAWDSWSSNWLSSPNESVIVGESGGAYGGFTDSLGGIVDTAGGWLTTYLNYQNQRDLVKYQQQLAIQQALLNTVETNQRPNAVPYPVNQTLFNTQQGGVSGGSAMLIGAAALAAVFLVVK